MAITVRLKHYFVPPVSPLHLHAQQTFAVYYRQYIFRHVGFSALDLTQNNINLSTFH